MKKLLAICLASALVTSLVGCSADTKACNELSSQIDTLKVALDYMKADVTAQNLTGYSDVDGILKQIETIRTMAEDLKAIQGSEEFVNKRLALSTAFTNFFDASVLAVKGTDTSAIDFATQDVQEKLLEIGAFCG